MRAFGIHRLCDTLLLSQNMASSIAAVVQRESETFTDVKKVQDTFAMDVMPMVHELIEYLIANEVDPSWIKSHLDNLTRGPAKWRGKE